MGEKRRNHPLSMVKNFLLGFIKTFIPLVILAFKDWEDGSTFFLALIVIFGVLVFIVQILAWKYATYEIGDGKMKVESGVFVKKRNKILLDRIQTFDISRPLIYRPFKVVNLKIDTGNTSENESEMSFDVSEIELERIRDIVFVGDDAEIDKEDVFADDDAKTFEASRREVFVLGLTSARFWTGLVAFFAVFSFFSKWIKTLFSLDLYDYLIESAMVYDVQTIRDIRHIAKIGVVILLFMLVLILLATIKNYLRYKNFRVTRLDHEICIEYGFLDKKQYHLPVEKISALYFRETMMQSIVGYQKLCIETIGYGNENGEEEVLYPMIKKDDANSLVKELLPEMYFDEDMSRAESRTLKRFIFRSISWRIAISAILMIFAKRYVGIFVYPVVVLLILDGIFIGYMNHNHSQIGFNKKHLSLSYKGRGREIIVIPIEKIEGFQISQNLFQKNKGLIDYKFSIWANDSRGEYKIRDLAENKFEKSLCELPFE
ncbi:MAG: PH domain-containing protein [Tissierellales bacterium]|nr:PH domain-containing protein [Tissierellales bacterium]